MYGLLALDLVLLVSSAQISEKITQPTGNKGVQEYKSTLTHPCWRDGKKPLGKRQYRGKRSQLK